MAALIVAPKKCGSGRIHAALFYRESGTPHKLSLSPQVYRFSSGTKKSLGLLKVRIPTGDSKFMYREVDVVRANIPFLIGFDFLDYFGMFIDNVKNALVRKALLHVVDLGTGFGNCEFLMGKQLNMSGKLSLNVGQLFTRISE